MILPVSGFTYILINCLYRIITPDSGKVLVFSYCFLEISDILFTIIAGFKLQCECGCTLSSWWNWWRLEVQLLCIRRDLTSLSIIRIRCNPLKWRHNGRNSVANHQPHDCLLNRLFKRRSKKISKLRVTGLCAANSPGTGEFPAQMASYAENVSIWWRHHAMTYCLWTWSKQYLVLWAIAPDWN